MHISRTFSEKQDIAPQKQDIETVLSAHQQQFENCLKQVKLKPLQVTKKENMS